MGLFRSQYSTRGGFRLATFGTLLIGSGIAAGVFVGMPKLHQSMALTDAPVSLTCIELLRDGVPENTSMVTLRDAQVHPPGELMIGSDEHPLPPMLSKMSGVLADPRATAMVDRLVRGDVSPRGVIRCDGPQPLGLSPGRETAEAATREIEETGSLTVHVSEDPTARLVCQAADYLQLAMPETMKQAASIPTYLLQPVSQIATRREASVWVLGGAVAVAIGFVLCGSASLGWWALFSPLGAILGLPGWILRSGRGGKLTWLITLSTGAAAIGGGFYLVVTLGRLGLPGGDWAWHSAGFLAVSWGAAAMIGTVLSIRANRGRSDSVDALAGITPAVENTRSKKKSKRTATQSDDSNQSMTESRPAALESMISRNDYTHRYLDSPLNVSTSMETVGEVQQQTANLEKLQFDAPLIIGIGRGEDAIEGTVQVGCRNLVLAMTDCFDEDLRFRMVSFLDDGHVVVSGNGQDPRLSETVNGDTASLRTFNVTDAAKMVTKHLEAAAEIAERRQTSLIELDPSEWRDMVHYSERCMADTLHHAYVEKWDISDEQYGRFGFPPRQVDAHVMV